MNSDPPPAGIALLCDLQGIIQAVLRDGSGLNGLAAGQSLENLVDSGSRIKLLNFLVELRGRGRALDWEINFPRQDRLVTLRMTGLLGLNNLAIVGAHTPYAALALCDEFQGINPGLAAALRSEIQEHLQATSGQNEEGSIYDEITRLNNDLLALQRQLAKKNAELDQRVQERTTQLQAANQELEAFSYSISHELRSPLRGINGWSQLLYEDYHDQLDETGRQFIERIRGETQRMATLIDALLRLSGINRAEMKWERVDLSQMAGAIAARLQAENPGRPVEAAVQPGLAALGDPDLLEMMLENLLANAFKFSSKVSQPCIEFGKTSVAGEPAFFVRDNGAGFDMAYARHLFGAFQTMHSQAEYPGTGAGLAIVQRIIHRHGGKIWAEGAVGQGATFYFTLLEGR